MLEMYEGIDKHKAKLPDQVDGEHLWVFMAMFQVKDFKPGGVAMLDKEALLTVDGPGCFWCEKVWTPEVAASPCGGSVHV